jgi:hypothetical protein
MQNIKIKILFFVLLFGYIKSTIAQDTKIGSAFFDGIIHVGYVDNGGFVNFSGPSLSATYGQSKLALSMLPSLRFKVDKGSPKNTSIFPSLGFGFSYNFKLWSVQLPLYYNPKTANNNGSWHPGLGLGFRINSGKKK